MHIANFVGVNLVKNHGAVRVNGTVAFKPQFFLPNWLDFFPFYAR